MNLLKTVPFPHLTMMPSESYQPLQLKGEIMDLEFTLDTDHRKRRRNRTTQSCLNCHTSKRKCDRKRPCQRCIQLGLTGLCVYEIDDPALRDDPSIDENTRLRNRIAELESLVRELRGKPHPKWAENNFRDGDPNEKWHSRAAKCVPPSKRNSHTVDGTNGTRGVSTLLSPIKTEPATDSPTQLYRFTPSPAPYHTFHADSRGSSSSSYENSHRHSYAVNPSTSVQYQGQIQNAPLNDQTSSPVSHSQHENGGNYPLTRNHEDGRSYEDHQYANNGQCYCPCRSSTGTAVAYISLQQQLRSCLSSIRQYMPHSSNTTCMMYRRVLDLHNLIQVNDPTDSAQNYESSRTPSEIMSPISASSGQASFHTGSPQAVSPQEWNNLTNGGYNPYFPITSGEHNIYSHVMT
ncbi:hypothetical protein AX15_005900 [Amanita polypyramis BW_CC]|nr:hypothetical protein AX15_005900 [Amanita polypyramis BW_CC]